MISAWCSLRRACELRQSARAPPPLRPLPPPRQPPRPPPKPPPPKPLLLAPPLTMLQARRSPHAAPPCSCAHDARDQPARVPSPHERVPSRVPHERAPPRVPHAHAGCTQDAASAASASASKRQRTETARVRHGRELREALGRVATLLAHDKSKQAKTAFEAIDQGPAAKDGLAKVRANELRQLLFTFGGFNLTKASLDRFLAMPEVKRLLDEDLLKSRQEMADAKTATAMLQVTAPTRPLHAPHPTAPHAHLTSSHLPWPRLTCTACHHRRHRPQSASSTRCSRPRVVGLTSSAMRSGRRSSR
eukprot:4451853-Prymnesium_polylepis.1